MHPAGVAAGCAIATFYTLFSLVIQYSYYTRRPADAASWKVQPDKGASRLGPEAAAVPWIPLLDGLLRPDHARVKRAPWHWALASVNLGMASLIAALTVDAIATGRTKVYLTWPAEYSALSCALSWTWQTAAIVSLHQIEEYYWHRLMHVPWFYKRFHKMHHAYKSPEPFDDMYIHPLEALGYYVILYSPPFTLPMHWSAFASYMAVMGTCGVLDHSGVRLSLPLVYDTADHDVHHKHFEVNYAFPFPFMDLLHGTYRGQWGGRTWGAIPGSHNKQSEGGSSSGVVLSPGSSGVGTQDRGSEFIGRIDAPARGNDGSVAAGGSRGASQRRSRPGR